MKRPMSGVGNLVQ